MLRRGDMSGLAHLPEAMKIVEIRAENANTQTFVLDGALAAVPGQYVMAWLPGMEEKPFSLADVRPLSLTVAAVGPFSRALHGLRVGDSIWVRGPLGRGFQLPPAAPPGQHLLLIGGGYGVAPLHFLARQLLAAGHQVSMIIGARSAMHLLLVEAFGALAVRLWLTTEDGSAGLRGLVTDAIPAALAGASDRPTCIYACGPVGMLQAIAARCEADGIPVQLSWESHMRCGMGLCGSCEVGEGWLTCLDGPVFPFNPLTTPPSAVEFP